jgi:subtilisin-like proprotein convertase family protein
MSRRLLSVLVIALVLGMGTLAHAEWLGINSNNQSEPQIDVTQLGTDLTQVEITMSGLDVTEVNVAGESYSQIRIPGHWFTLDQGAPEVPFLTSSLIIPDAGTPVVRVIESVWRDIAADPLIPSKGNLLRTEDPRQIAYEFGPAYTQGGLYPAEEAVLADPYILRDYRGVSLRIHPVRWDADRGVLMALESMTLTVETRGTGGVNEKKMHHAGGIDPQFASLYSLGFDNYDSASKYNMLSDQGRMLIVCNDAFMSLMVPFIEWKQQIGMDVEMISTGSVGGTTAGIQAHIDMRYAEPEGLTYVILVGDQAQVPSYSGTNEGADDDTRYANQEGGDLYPDLFISRISGQVPEDIQSQVNKFIRYERDPDAGGTWYSKGTGLASSEGSPADYERAEWLRADMLGYNYTFVDEIYQPSGTSAMIAAAVNEGRSLVNYIGHGSGTSWSNPPFTSTDANNLTNGYMNPWVLDVSCSNGDFSMSECFAEAWMRSGTAANPNGAVAMYSASTSTPWVPPCVMQAEAVDLMVADQANIIGSLYYHGIMKVMDVYPGDTQLVEQYNIFGDCSLMIRNTTPVAMDVVHGGTVYIGAPVFPVDTGVAGATVSLFSNGVLHGTGVTDGAGHVDLALSTPVTEAGLVTLTVDGYNLLTHQEELPAAVAVGVAISPASIPVGVTTSVTVTLTDPDRNIANVGITVGGYGFSMDAVYTDVTGVAVFDVTPAYGETLMVIGREDGTTFDMFAEPLVVTGAAALGNVVLAVDTAEVGLTDALAVGFTGSITYTSTTKGLSMVAVGSGVDASASSAAAMVSVDVVPNAEGLVVAALMAPGYEVQVDDVPVITAMGSLSGQATEADNPSFNLFEVAIRIFASGDDPAGTPLVSMTTGVDGTYATIEDLPAGSYDLYAAKFGYISLMENTFLMHGANVFDMAMGLAPAGVLTGTVVSAEDGSPINANIQIFRTDTGLMVNNVFSDAGTGVYTSAALTYFDYEVKVLASHFIPQTMVITIAQESTIKNFILEPTVGNVLVIDDVAAREEIIYHGPKFDKNGHIISDSYSDRTDRSAIDILTDLTAMGYSVNYATTAAYDYADWANNDLVIVASGNSTSTLTTQLKLDMISFVNGGGHILVEGGEVGYDHQSDAVFIATVLHIADFISDSVGDVTVADAAHYVMSFPNTITGPIALTYGGYGDSDAVSLAADADLAGSWSGSVGNGSVVCFDPNPAPEGGQTVFFSFNYSALAAPARADLLQNAVIYLMTEELGTSSIAGSVDLDGTSDDSGVSVVLTPGGQSVITGADGSFLLEGVFAGNSTLTVSKDGWSTVAVDLTLAEGENLTGVNLILTPVTYSDFCDSPGVSIPDNNTAGVSTFINVDVEAVVSSVEVQVDITHTYIGDLLVELVSPAGTRVTLHSRSGGSADNIYTWYPAETTPAGSLDTIIGEGMMGPWELFVSDNAGADLGTINAWCLKIFHGEDTSPAGDAPQALALNGNYPNPFNPMTKISFSLPQAQDVELAVYDVRGVRVATLLREAMSEGTHDVTWYGRDDAGRTVSSGTYFYQLTVGSDKLTGKMLLMK